MMSLHSKKQLWLLQMQENSRWEKHQLVNVKTNAQVGLFFNLTFLTVMSQDYYGMLEQFTCIADACANNNLKT